MSCLRGDSWVPVSFISEKLGENAPVLGTVKSLLEVTMPARCHISLLGPSGSWQGLASPLEGAVWDLQTSGPVRGTLSREQTGGLPLQFVELGTNVSVLASIVNKALRYFRSCNNCKEGFFLCIMITYLLFRLYKECWFIVVQFSFKGVIS